MAHRKRDCVVKLRLKGAFEFELTLDTLFSLSCAARANLDRGRARLLSSQSLGTSRGRDYIEGVERIE